MKISEIIEVAARVKFEKETGESYDTLRPGDAEIFCADISRTLHYLIDAGLTVNQDEKSIVNPHDTIEMETHRISEIATDLHISLEGETEEHNQKAVDIFYGCKELVAKRYM